MQVLCQSVKEESKTEREGKKRGGGGSKKCRKNDTFEKHSPVILASNIFWRHYFLFIGKLGIKGT